MTDSTIASSFLGEPTIGPELLVGNPRVVRRRALIGWDHQVDNPHALLQGRIYGWANKGPKTSFFQVYDTNGNRGPTVHVSNAAQPISAWS